MHDSSSPSLIRTNVLHTILIKRRKVRGCNVTECKTTLKGMDSFARHPSFTSVLEYIILTVVYHTSITLTQLESLISFVMIYH